MCDHSSGVIAGWMLDEDDEQEQQQYNMKVIGELCVCQQCVSLRKGSSICKKRKQ
jgi:hypothetical protein